MKAFPRTCVALDVELVVREIALHDELTPLELGALHLVARGALGGAPDHRHRLQVLGFYRTEERLHRIARRRSTRELHRSSGGVGVRGRAPAGYGHQKEKGDTFHVDDSQCCRVRT